VRFCFIRGKNIPGCLITHDVRPAILLLASPVLRGDASGALSRTISLDCTMSDVVVA
jgi:hypothetical protein